MRSRTRGAGPDTLACSHSVHFRRDVVDPGLTATVECSRLYLLQIPDLPTAFIDAIADRNVVDREIGASGTATVHLAWDVGHNRSVAIKVLKPELATPVGIERFLKEIEVAVRLTHPHIIPLYDSGAVAGFLSCVMPFIDGESLRARLRRQTRLETATALDIVQHIGYALSYAHRQDVLQRDITPDNLLFAEGHPLVADFGIARAVSRPAVRTSRRRVWPSAPRGT